MYILGSKGRRNEGGTDYRENVSGVLEERRGRQTDEKAEKERKKSDGNITQHVN